MPTSSAPLNMTAFEWGLLLTLSVLWGGSFFFAEVALVDFPPMTVVAVRVILGAAILHLVLVVIGKPARLPMKLWGAFIAMGLLNNVIPFSLIVWGQVHIASGLASILNATTPLVGLIVAHLMTRDEKITGAKAAGIIIGFAGVAVMIGSSALETLGTEVWAQLAILGATLSYSFAAVFGKRFKALPPTTAAAGQLTGSAIVMIPLVCLIDQPWTLPQPSAQSMLALVGIAVFSTALAYVIVFRILQSAGAVNLLLVTFLVPVSAITMGVLILGESLTPDEIIGMALIGVGLVCVDGRLLRQVKKASH